MPDDTPSALYGWLEMPCGRRRIWGATVSYMYACTCPEPESTFPDKGISVMYQARGSHDVRDVRGCLHIRAFLRWRAPRTGTTCTI